jgi:hypothetical protein
VALIQGCGQMVRIAMTLRYKLRTLLILLAILPPLLWFGWTKYEAWQAERERQRWRLHQIPDGGTVFFGGLSRATAPAKARE